MSHAPAPNRAAVAPAGRRQATVSAQHDPCPEDGFCGVVSFLWSGEPAFAAPDPVNVAVIVWPFSVPVPLVSETLPFVKVAFPFAATVSVDVAGHQDRYIPDQVQGQL